MLNKKNIFISLGLLFLLTGCSNVKTLDITPESNIINKESALQIRDIQVRTFEKVTKEELINSIVDTLLDDGYFVTMIDSDSGIISAKNSQKNPELNIVSTIKKIKNSDFLVRFSITAIDKSLAFKSHVIITDDLIYRYLFDRLRKSLFLDKEFYNVPPKEQNETKIEITIEKPFAKEKKIEKTTKKTPQKKCVNQKCKDNSSLIYSVQFLCTLDKNQAQKEFNKLKSQNHDVRIHPYHQYQVVRLGRFKTRLEAQNAMQEFKKFYPEISIVGFKPKY